MPAKYLTKENVEELRLKEGDLVEVVFDECPKVWVDSGTTEKRFPIDVAVGYYVGLAHSGIPDEASIRLSSTLRKTEFDSNHFIIPNGIFHITKFYIKELSSYSPSSVHKDVTLVTVSGVRKVGINYKFPTNI